MKQLLTSLTALLLASGGCTSGEEPEATIRIDLARRGADIPASMYGIFFEEINHAGDGGLYAELIQNRGFEDSSVPEGYTVKRGPDLSAGRPDKPPDGGTSPSRPVVPLEP